MAPRSQFIVTIAAATCGAEGTESGQTTTTKGRNWWKLLHSNSRDIPVAGLGLLPSVLPS